MSAFEISHHSTLCIYNCFLSKLEILSDTDLTIHSAPITKHCFTGNTHLCSEKTIFTDDNTMTYHDLAINLCPRPNNRITTHTLSDSCSGANPNIIFDNHTPASCPWLVFFRPFFKIESLCTNDRT